MLPADPIFASKPLKATVLSLAMNASRLSERTPVVSERRGKSLIIKDKEEDEGMGCGEVVNAFGPIKGGDECAVSEENASFSQCSLIHPSIQVRHHVGIRKVIESTFCFEGIMVSVWSRQEEAIRQHRVRWHIEAYVTSQTSGPNSWCSSSQILSITATSAIQHGEPH